MTVHIEVTPDQLQRLHDSLTRNAATFRQHGHDKCATESQRLADKVAEAMKEAST